METTLRNVRNANALFSGTLEVGNHDTITLFGADSQARLRDHSRAIANAFLSDTSELDAAIDNVIAEIEKFESCAKRKSPYFFTRRNRCEVLDCAYNRVIAYIDRVNLYFQLQQAQLLRENKYLENLAATIDENIASLDKQLEIGQGVLNGGGTVDVGENGFQQSYAIGNLESNYDSWYTRLHSRINELRVSRAIAMQSQAQIRLLCSNNLTLLDRISIVTTHTFPVWRNQIAVLLGMERRGQRLDKQNQLLIETNRQVISAFRKDNTVIKHCPLDIRQVTFLNSNLRNTLSEIIDLEKMDYNIKISFQNAVNHIEGGADK